MRLLFTGASSFSGLHFIRILAQAGYDVHGVFTRKALNEYSGVRHQRVKHVLKWCTPHWNMSFGDPQFLKLLEREGFTHYIHHMAWTHGYNTPSYNEERAFHNNVYQLHSVEERLLTQGCREFVITGSIFEGLGAHVGFGEAPFEAHGHAKRKTTLYIQQNLKKLHFRRFVIPNPFGCWDQIRFVEYLVSSWIKNRIPVVQTPNYIRDNIPVDLLSLYYLKFLQGQEDLCCPSGYVESNADFAKRIAGKVQQRGLLTCPMELRWHHSRLQPMELYHVNSPPTPTEWSEAHSWDAWFEHMKDRFRVEN